MLPVYKGGVDTHPQAIMNALRSAFLAGTGSRPRIGPLLTTALLLLTCGCLAVTRASEPAGRPLQPVIATILDAWNRTDAHAIAAQYETTGDFVSPDGMHANGRQAIETFYAGAFARGYAGSRATATLVHVRNLSGTIALVDGAWRIEPTSAAKVRQPEAGLFFAVLRRHGVRWLIAALREQSSAGTLRELDTGEHRARAP